jgi:putrescine transport system permease protein
MGEYVIPYLLGGPDALLIGRVLFDEFYVNRDWPLASAVASIPAFTSAADHVKRECAKS